MKKCPFCAEEVQDKAVKCKYCNSTIPDNNTAISSPHVSKQKEKWSTKKRLKYIGLVILALIFWFISIPGIAIWYVWEKTSLDRTKKWLATLGIVVAFLLMVGTVFSDSDELATNSVDMVSEEVTMSPEEVAKQEVEAQQKAKELASQSINYLRNYESPAPRDNSEAIGAEIAEWDRYAVAVMIAKGSTDPEMKQLGDDLEKALKETQVKEFPKLRKAAGDVLDKMMWEYDVDVEIKGNANSIITLTGGLFAANKNIATIQASIIETLELLRFDRIEYRLYKGASDYQYYDIESKGDGELYSL